jgi:hypothetical protein
MGSARAAIDPVRYIARAGKTDDFRAPMSRLREGKLARFGALCPRAGAGFAGVDLHVFRALGRNAERISDYLQLPCDQVVEIGREIAI